MVINVHGGHNSIVPGASGVLNEVTEDRKVTALVLSKLQQLGHTVYDCTDDSGRTQAQNLSNIVSKCNAHSADLNVSIHFNAGGGHGVEVLVYSDTSKAKSYATAICSTVAALGFTNRGVKVRNNLYVLKKTKAPALLVECCFVDSDADKALYNAESMANAIVKGITGQTAKSSTSATTATTASSSGYKVKITASTLNVRKDHSASSAIATTVKKGDVYTIVEEYNNGGTTWGKLKSGAGWISLKYTSKV
jgi:N-acetylmuramoyl-L-alanine amidase